MKSNNLIDYHLHSAGTIDCKMTEMEVCERALQTGIEEIAFTNHVMLTQPDYHISPGDYQAHWERIQACQKRHPEIRVRVGLEMDYYPGREGEISETLQQYEKLIDRPMDIVLGSIHDLHGNFFSNRNCAASFFQGHDLVSLYFDYFRIASNAVQTGLFDIMAHPDLIKKYTNDLTEPVPFERYRAAVEPFIDALLDSNVGIEVNTKGLTISVGEMYPSNEFLELYLRKALDFGKDPILTTGSDAHTVEDVGRSIPEAAMVLKKMGFKSLSGFEKHQRFPRLL